MLPLAMLTIFCMLPTVVSASIQVNHLQRIDLVQKNNYTRLTFKLREEPDYSVVQLPGKRLRVSLKNTEGPLFKRLRYYSDKNIGGLILSQRGKDLTVTFPISSGDVGWREVHVSGLTAISFDVGTLFAKSPVRYSPPGRERIIGGAEKLLRDFDPPVKPEIPFIPTDREALKGILTNDEQKQFLAAEGSLYKGKIIPAEEVFAQYAARVGSPIRPLALYRLAEAQYRLQKYPQALASFREAEHLWGDFLSINPSSMFYYGDSIVRNGDLPGGRQLLARLIVANSDKKYAPILLVRMADAMARRGNEQGAVAIYRTVAEEFKTNKAHEIARMKLADRRFFAVTPDTFGPLAATYRDIAEKAGDYDLREEASFKAVLLESINAPPEVALESVVKYQKRFPKGVYIKVLHDIRDDLAELVYLTGGWDRNPSGLVRLVTENQDYLASALKVKGFLPAVSSAYEKAGRPLDLIALYSGLLERPWVGESNAPFLYFGISDQADLLGDSLMAKKTLQAFVLRFPSDPDTRMARERLAALSYVDGETEAVRDNLLWLLNRGEQARYPVSYYYLGRSLLKEKNYPQAANSMGLYIASVKPGEKKQPPLLWDAYYVAAISRDAIGQRPEALALLDTGRKIAPKENADQFLYKMAEINLQDGQRQKARSLFEQLSKDGKDPDWRRLATQSLESMNIPSPPSEEKSKVK